MRCCTLLALVTVALGLSEEEVTRINEDGSSQHPTEMRALMRKTPQLMDAILTKNPELHAVVLSDDLEAFQSQMRVMNRARSMNEDGSAVDPEAYVEGIMEGGQQQGINKKEWLKKIKSDDPEMHKALTAKKDERLEKMQELLRERKKSRDHAEWVKNQPPPPATPYDEVGDVGMSFRVRTDEGEEKDMFMLSPKANEDEKRIPQLPLHMECAACAGFSHQAGSALTEAFKKNDLIGEKKWREPEVMVAEQTIAALCSNTGLWQGKYGIEAGRRGNNLLTGPGIPQHPDSLKGDTAIMGQMMHSEHLGKQMWDACEVLVVGSDEDDEIVPTVNQANADGEDPGDALRELLCDKPCAKEYESQGKVGLKKKKKKKKKATDEAKQEL